MSNPARDMKGDDKEEISLSESVSRSPARGDSIPIEGKTRGVGEHSKSTVDSKLALQNYVPDTPEEKALVRKIDNHLIPTLWVMYILNYVDRTNIGNARIGGMEDDLHLNDTRYAWILSIFFFGYLICEIPSNMILSRSKPSTFLPGIMIVWGFISAIMSVANNYAAMLAFRFVLGFIEAGFFPGVLFVMSCWYKEAEVGKRFAAFYTASVISGAFGGLIAGAITGHMDGARGIAGWRWLFIIEGTATVAFAIVAKFILLDFPATSRTLTQKEREMAVARILHDGIATGSSDRQAKLTHWEAFVAAISDPRTYLFLFLFVLDVGAGTISYFIPTITKTLGYSSVKAQYMTIPIYIVAAIILNLTAYSADRHGDRRWHITAALGLGFICSVVCATVLTPVVRYVMICFVAAGIWSALPLILAWTSSTIALPAEKRAIAIALVNAVGNLASVYGSRIWPTWNSPSYTIGFGVTAAFLGTGTVMAALIPVLIRIIPRKGTNAERRLEETGREKGTEIVDA